jgi:hypothetical protein
VDNKVEVIDWKDIYWCSTNSGVLYLDATDDAEFEPQFAVYGEPRRLYTKVRRSDNMTSQVDGVAKKHLDNTSIAFGWTIVSAGTGGGKLRKDISFQVRIDQASCAVRNYQQITDWHNGVGSIGVSFIQRLTGVSINCALVN